LVLTIAVYSILKEVEIPRFNQSKTASSAVLCVSARNKPKKERPPLVWGGLSLSVWVFGCLSVLELCYWKTQPGVFEWFSPQTLKPSNT
jgi:hypothetical protein